MRSITLKANPKPTNVAVLGGGLWGAVLANHLANNGHSVRLWEFFDQLAKNLEESRRHPHIPHFELNMSVRVSSDMKAVVDNAEIIVVVLPSAHIRPTAKKLAGLLKGRKPWIVNASKGVEPKTLMTMGEILGQEIPWLKERIYTISGPSFAREVARKIPTALVLAGPKSSKSAELRSVFAGHGLNIELSTDRKGVELGGSLKNVLAIGCGILDGLKAGANTKAAFITLGIAEMSRMIQALGGKRDTVYGLSGIGDLMATGTSPESRNRAFGEKLGEGKTPEQAILEIPTVTEGVESAQSAHELIVKRKISCPLLDAVWSVAKKGAPPEKVLDALGFSSYAHGAFGH